MCCVVMCCVVLCCAVLCCAVLCCAVLFGESESRKLPSPQTKSSISAFSSLHTTRFVLYNTCVHANTHTHTQIPQSCTVCRRACVFRVSLSLCVWVGVRDSVSVCVVLCSWRVFVRLFPGTTLHKRLLLSSYAPGGSFWRLPMRRAGAQPTAPECRVWLCRSGRDFT